MILKRFKKAVALLFVLNDTAGVVGVEFAGSGCVAVMTEVLFVPHYLLDGFVERLFVPSDDLESPSGGVLNPGFLLSFIV